MTDRTRNSIKSQTMAESRHDGLFLKRRGGSEFGDMQSEPHRDDYYLFGIIAEGEAVVAIDFKEIRLTARQAIILTPGQIHFSLKSSGNMAGWLMAISPEHLDSDEAEAIERYSLNPVPVTLSDRSYTQLTSLLDIMYDRMGETHIALHLAGAVRSLIFSEVRTDAADVSDRHREITLRFKRLLDKNIRDEKQPAKYAGMLNISPSYMNEAVKAVTGLNVSALIRGKAVLHAKRLLRHTSLTAQEIAYDLGYDDYAYFSKLFKKETGVSPARFRRDTGPKRR